MTAQPLDVLQHAIDKILPVDRVLAQAHAFLAKCGWQLEIDDALVSIPPNVELCVRSRAFITADVDDVFGGHHFEAVVLIGKEINGRNVCATHGILRIYFDGEGQFMSADQYNKYH